MRGFVPLIHESRPPLGQFLLAGEIHDPKVELTEDLGVPDGQVVEITIKTIASPKPWGEGLWRCAGAFAADWTEEDDRILEEIHQERKRETRKEISG